MNEIKILSGNENISQVRILNRYDIQGLSDSELDSCKNLIFSEPFTDNIIENLPGDSNKILAVEYLPGQYDQRADSAEQCAGLLLGFRPVIKTARIYLFYGELNNFDAVKKFLINPVESREAQLNEYDSLDLNYSRPDDVKIIDDLLSTKGLAMSREDLECCKKYFDSENRKPTAAEIKVLDTYWSDHCRHTTFLTHINSAEILDNSVSNMFAKYLEIRKELNYSPDKPVTLMDIATIGAKFLKSRGLLPDLVDSEENNACTVKININNESWLLLFKNETHNHPTEIEPFGGAATCIGGAIRDPLSGRAYVYQAMRITGAADPFKATMPGKLPQRAIITKSAAGYSSYGNQIGIPTGLVDEIYHEGYRAKRLEVGAVLASVPEKNVIRERPESGDYVLLLGGKTGRDGIGGATGSSVSHSSISLETCGAEVQKGNAPEERKLQRLFRNPEFTRLIKRCNDFGAGGVSVAVGELADGLDIDLDSVPLKYAGLDGTEIAVSESQERMAVVVSERNIERVKNLALSEDVQASIIARVNNSGSMRMTWRGHEIVNLSREFINSSGAERNINVKVNQPVIKTCENDYKTFQDKLFAILKDLNVCSKQGLSEIFDSTVGAHSLLMPFGGKFQKTPAQAMAAEIFTGSQICSLMSYGFDPFISESSPFRGAYIAVLDSLCKIIASGGNLKHCWLTLQEYFGKPGYNPEKWGLPFAALLGALRAQLDFNVAAIGGKDSMSGSFVDDTGKNYDVPPTLISFCVCAAEVDKIISPEFKRAGSNVYILSPDYDSDNLPTPDSMKNLFALIQELNANHKILSCYVPTFGGIHAAIFKMCLGNNLGFEFENNNLLDDSKRCKFIIELADENENLCRLGRVIETPEIICDNQRVNLNDAAKIYNSTLENIFPTEINDSSVIPDFEINSDIPRVFYSHESKSNPKFLIPVFNGTNCEYETANAINNAGGNAKIFVVKTLTPELMQESAHEFAQELRDSQALVIPGGFSNGDEPDGSGKFIAIFLRSPEVRESVENLIDSREGLILGICNGFQALVKTGLLPFGKFTNPEDLFATLTFNKIGRHQSRIIRSRVISNYSPWLRKNKVGEVYSMPISHGEGRFICSHEIYKSLMNSGQVASQYVDLNNIPSMKTEFNPAGSSFAIECITSPDGRILGRMGHVERFGASLYKNVAGNYDTKIFESACEYFRKI